MEKLRLLLFSFLSSYGAMILIIVLSSISGFSVAYSEALAPTLLPPENVWRIQWLISYGCMMVALYRLWKFGYVRRFKVQMATVAYFLQILLLCVYVYVVPHVTNYFSALSLPILFFLVFLWVVELFRRADEFAALYLAPIIVFRALTMYYAIHTVLVRADSWSLF